MTLALNAQRCTRCGRCVPTCPAAVFTSSQDHLAAIDESRVEYCIHCGHCEAVCPGRAITVDGVDPATLELLQPAPLNALQQDMLFKARRSTRNFSDKPVPRDVLAAALEDARYAPSARNQQVVEWLVITDPTTLRALKEEMAARLIAAGGPYAAFGHLYREGRDVLLRGAPCLVIAHAPMDLWAAADCAAAVSYLELSLHSRGLGTCWSGLVIATAVQSPLPPLDLPEGRRPLAGLMTGYASIPFTSLPPRPRLRVRWA